jgi:hypothetical protein
MSKGFGFKQQTRKQYIKNFIRNSRVLLNGFESPEEAKQYISKMWFKTYSLKNNDYSIEQLLSPAVRDLEIVHNPRNDVPEYCKIAGYNGLWRVMLIERPDNSLDLDIGVMAGSGYRFHSGVIKHSIVTKFGYEVYDQWRFMVKSNIESLKQLIRVIRTEIDCIPWSYTCSESSARLCNQVGIETYRGAAFLFPASYR